MSDDICRQLDEMMQDAKRRHQDGIVHQSRVRLAKILYDSFAADAALIAAADAIAPETPATPLNGAPDLQDGTVPRQPLPHEQYAFRSPAARQFYHDDTTQE